MKNPIVLSLCVMSLLVFSCCDEVSASESAVAVTKTWNFAAASVDEHATIKTKTFAPSEKALPQAPAVSTQIENIDSNQNANSASINSVSPTKQEQNAKAPASPSLQGSVSANELREAISSLNDKADVTTSKAASDIESVNFSREIKTDKSSSASSTNSSIAKTTNGHKVSLNFQNIQTRVLLQLLAKTSGLNFIISESVKGSMTLHLNNVPWNQALDIILKANGLDSRRFGNVILVAPIQELADNEINELLARQKVAQLAPLQSEIMTLNYANAEEIASILKGASNTILSPRGQVGVDNRTNSLWLRDLSSNLDEIRYYVRKLDVPAKQVLIEAKIVKIGTGYTRDLGVRFGVSRPGRLAGTLLKADGSVGDPANQVEAVRNRLNFNIPSGLEGAGSMALSLIKMGGKNFLDLELSALEEEDHAETIASPRLITSNQKEAIIEQGEEIPYLAASSSGATSIEFKKAVLSLKITPQITPDRNIILQLKVTQDTRGKSVVLTTNDVADTLSSQLLPPAINTEQIESHVFLKNGQTIVIGGIFIRENNDTVRRVPFFGDIPVLGALFRSKVHDNSQNELLVFITPRIIDRGYMGPKYSHRYCGERKYKAI